MLNVARLKERIRLWKFRIGAARAGHTHARLGRALIPQNFIARAIHQRAVTTQVEK